jgi:hypothetical protein
MGDGNGEFDLHVDSVPPGELLSPVVAPPPQGHTTPMPPVYVDPAPAPTPQGYATPMPPTYAAPAPPEYAAPPQNYVVVPEYAAAPAAPPQAPPKSRRGVIVAVLLLLLLVNGAVVAHRYGWISLPDLTSSKKNAQGPGTNEKQPAAKEKEKIKPRPFKTTTDVLAAIKQHLTKTAEDDRKFQRYFTLDNLYNDKTLSEKQLDEYREALKALLRYLLPGKNGITLEPIDPAKMVLRLDVRTVGWQKPQTWREVLAKYPYGLIHAEAEDEDVKDLAQQITELSGSAVFGFDLPFVRADWFLVSASQGKLRTRLGPDAVGEPPAALTPLMERYQENVNVETAARELGLQDSQRLRDLVQGKAWLQNRGLRPFLDGGTVPRNRWGSPAGTGANTLFQEAAVELGFGTAYGVNN